MTAEFALLNVVLPITLSITVIWSLFERQNLSGLTQTTLIDVLQFSRIPGDSGMRKFKVRS